MSFFAAGDRKRVNRNYSGGHVMMMSGKVNGEPLQCMINVGNVMA